MQYINTVLNFFPVLEDKGQNVIRQNRILKEKQLCQQEIAMNIQWNKTEYGGDVVTFDFYLHGDNKNQGQILLGRQYPFYQPSINFTIDNNLFSCRNLEDFQKHDYYFPKRLWTPKLTVNEIIHNCVTFAQSNIQIREKVKIDFITELVNNMRKNTSYLMTSIIILLQTLLVRILMGFGKYSGYNDSPRFGDFEAQRHWMELTINSPPNEWYRQTTFNDLTWWRLDYPPLSAYLAWFVGMFSQLYDPKSVEGYESRGYENPHHKNFMRWSVLIVDLIFLYPILIICIKSKFKKFNFDYQYSAILLILVCPFLIIIDHGHFQYNCIAVGLSLMGAYLCADDQLILGSMLFTCALNFKQMSLYYSLGFFAFILGKIAISSELRSQNRLKLNFSRLPYFIGYVLIIGLTVLATTALIWLPWLDSIESIREVLIAIFPVHRGLYQLKVATFWCISNVIVKWENIFTNSSLVVISTFLTVILSIPAMICLTINPKLKPFTIGLFVIAQLFFLFGFHVHEKTILLPLVFLLINIRSFGHIMNDYVTIAGITMYPLMKEDGLSIQFLVLWGLYQLINYKYIEMNMGVLIKQEKLDMEGSSMEQKFSMFLMLISVLHRKLMMKLIIGGFLIIIGVEQIVAPPIKFPFLYPLIYAFIGFYGFVFTLVYAYTFLIRHTIQSLNKKKQD